MPVEASQEDNSDWISNADITDFVRAIEAKYVLIVSDSCYSGTLSRSINTTRGIRIDPSQPDAARDYFTRMSKKRTRVVLSSGGLEPVADSGVGGHFVFANAFMEALTTNEGVTDGATIFSIVRRRVIENADQTPTYAKIPKTNDQDGDFIFAKGK